MVDYKTLQKARDIVKAQFGESCTYDLGVELITKI